MMCCNKMEVYLRNKNATRIVHYEYSSLWTRLDLVLLLRICFCRSFFSYFLKSATFNIWLYHINALNGLVVVWFSSSELSSSGFNLSFSS